MPVDAVLRVATSGLYRATVDGKFLGHGPARAGHGYFRIDEWPLKDFAGITSEVTLVGQGYKFQIWEPARFRSHLEEARNQVRELRKQLGARHVGANPDIGPDSVRPQPRGVQE